MSTTGSLLPLSILILSTGILLSSLYTIDRAQAVESNCDDELLSLLPCSLGAENRSSSITSARTAQEYKENVTLGTIVDASGGSEFIAENDNDNNNKEKVNTNIESQIPSTISVVPFP